jgi:HK97 gp10 family phage protein
MATSRGTREGKEAGRVFKQIGYEAQTNVEKALVKAGLLVEREAKLRAPVDEGRLRNSISSRLINSSNVEVGTNVYYAKFVEYGTTKMRAQPYLNPALIVSKIKIKNLLMAAIQEALRGG